MTSTALELKKAQTEAYFNYHPDSIDIEVLDGAGGSVTDTVQGLFDSALIQEDARQMGAVERNKRMTRVTIYSGNAALFTPRTTWIRVDGVEWKVRDVETDKTPGTLQSILRLV